MSQSRYAGLSRSELAVLLPELLLIGQLIDRSGMAWCIQAFGRQEMLQIAIEEWAGASPIYTKRMQKALNFEGDDVPTIFKGLQLDIGAPPQFMDFRFTLHDRWHGEFHLDHCGALLDVEPMGDDYVVGMCHTIEDPTFDATAIATNPRAQVRPIHRPPRKPADRHPHGRLRAGRNVAGPSGGAQLASPRRRRLDFVVHTGIRAAVAGHRHRCRPASEGSDQRDGHRLDRGTHRGRCPSERTAGGVGSQGQSRIGLPVRAEALTAVDREMSSMRSVKSVAVPLR